MQEEIIEDEEVVIDLLLVNSKIENIDKIIKEKYNALE